MVATLNRSALRNRLSHPRSAYWALVVAQTLAMFGLAQRGWWVPAIAAIVIFELGWQRRAWRQRQPRWQIWHQLAPMVLAGVSAALIVAMSPRLATQIGWSLAYALWRAWWLGQRDRAAAHQMTNALIEQAVWFEAVFLMAGVWRVPDPVVLVLAWLGAYVITQSALLARGERTAGLMAAAWGVMVVQVAAVLLLWLFTYVTAGGYVLVPQPALVLVALAYCFGSIHASARGGNLSRGRLAEYLFIGLIVIGMVIAGTSWRGGI